MKPPTLTRSEALELLVYVSGYRQSEIAKKAGIAASTLRNGLSGHDDLSDDAVRRVCKFLGVLPERVLDLEKGEWEEVR